MNKHIIALLNTRSHNQSAITCRCSNKQASSLLERPAIGNRQKRIFYSLDLCRKSALGCAEDSRSNRKLGVGAILGRCDDGTCKFGASDPGEGYMVLAISCVKGHGDELTGLVLVFSLDL
jgi:hypothetical protein